MVYEWTTKRLAYWKKTLGLYQITPTQLNELRLRLIIALGFKCGNCGRDLSEQTVYLDHDHHSGEIRGIACFNCNRFEIGGHTVETAARALRYLSNPPARELLPALLKALNTPEG